MELKTLSATDFILIFEKQTKINNVENTAIIRGVNKTLVEFKNIRINEPVTITSPITSFNSIRFVNLKCCWVLDPTDVQ
jgi:hypothetical protein